MNLIYKSIIRKILFRLDPEKAHDLTCDFLGFAETIPFARQVIKRFYQFESPSISLFGLNFPNCIGLAAGLDKNAMFSSISSSLGFGHVEVGTLTPNAQPGNPQPRLFRYPESEALVNRMGFNNHGAIAAVERLRKYNPKGKRLSPVGINIGKGKETPPEEAIEDYLHGFKIVSTQADFITINISSPNTPGLRLLHQKSFLDPLLEEVQKLNKSLASKNSSKLIPCLLKISPDEDFKGLESIISSALDYEIDGLIATNTTTSRKNSDFEMGGLSGKPLEERSLQSIKFIVKESENKIPVIGVGGIHDTESANKKLDAGSSLLQLYTSLIYKGPSFPSQLASSLNSRFAWL